MFQRGLKYRIYKWHQKLKTQNNLSANTWAKEENKEHSEVETERANTHLFFSVPHCATLAIWYSSGKAKLWRQQKERRCLGEMRMQKTSRQQIYSGRHVCTNRDKGTWRLKPIEFTAPTVRSPERWTWGEDGLLCTLWARTPPLCCAMGITDEAAYVLG